ncbi:CRISPR-associated endonuclease Cas2 [Thiomicrospira microaerophila]|uniref:CRISPR-associated endonuclease Cas2 n=1 Tax=Thiomicrospira microaerophila TaxID=406020 RepID=UPI000697A108|nr:CRISPR-associated endonuclease Cas2 [Thiomicrospira microaerophila]
MDNNAKWHVLAYDIRHVRRLAKIHRIVKKVGLPFQKSVFLIHASEKRLQKILSLIEKYMDVNEDDVRTYPVESAQTIWVYGLGLTPDLIMDSSPKISAWQKTKQWLKANYPKNNEGLGNPST